MSASEDDFFIGWAETPAADRRFFLRAGIGLVAGSAALGAGLASLQGPPGPGTWNPDDVRDWSGVVTSEPYALLRTHALDTAGARTVLLSCLGKCGVAARIGQLAGKPVVVRGSLIQRGPHAMLAVDESSDWIRLDMNSTALLAPLVFPAAEKLGAVELEGEVLDSKCWFGAMRPSEGKVHKACAALCIRGGIPPAFYSKGPQGQPMLMVLTTEGRAHGADLLPLVADRVRLHGQLYRRGDLLMLDAPVSALRRV
jgi:hypothetical protein